MSRKSLLTPLSKEEQASAQIKKVVAADERFLATKKTALKNQLAEIEEKIEGRLSGGEALSDTIINVEFFQYCHVEAQLKLVTDFEDRFLKDK